MNQAIAQLAPHLFMAALDTMATVARHKHAQSTTQAQLQALQQQLASEERVSALEVRKLELLLDAFVNKKRESMDAAFKETVDIYRTHQTTLVIERKELISMRIRERDEVVILQINRRLGNIDAEMATIDASVDEMNARYNLVILALGHLQ